MIRPTMSNASIRCAITRGTTESRIIDATIGTIARRTGYHAAFVRVVYYGKPLPCVRPGGRGLFGDAIVTKAGIESTHSRAFETQAGPERREWLCVRTRVGVDVCTAHLASPEVD